MSAIPQIHLPEKVTSRLYLSTASWIAVVLTLWTPTEVAIADCRGQPDTRSHMEVYGRYVYDSKTDLTWERCLLGMNYVEGEGCTGEFARYSFEQANTKLIAPPHWRIPTPNELLSLNTENCSLPRVDPEFFPTPDVTTTAGTMVPNVSNYIEVRAGKRYSRGFLPVIGQLWEQSEDIESDGGKIVQKELPGTYAVRFVRNGREPAVSEPVWTPSAPKITRFDTFREGELVFFRLYFAGSDKNIAGFGFTGANGSGWSKEAHPLSSPSYGRISPGEIQYPFNHQCGTDDEFESDVEAWVYTVSGQKSPAVSVHLSCTAPELN